MRIQNMQKSSLIPFVRNNPDILFIGLNPAKGSSIKKHYFSVNQAFWNQLYSSGLIIEKVDKCHADDSVFGSNKINYKNWQFGITDLVTQIAESNSTRIKPQHTDCEAMYKLIIKTKPKTAVILHGKVLNIFIKYLGYIPPDSNTGKIGKLITSCSTNFFNIAFPHGNSINSESKILRYKELLKFLEKPYSNSISLRKLLL